MIPATILAIIFVFFFLQVSRDFLIIIWNGGWSNENKLAQKVFENPQGQFLKQREFIEPLLIKHFEYFRKLSEHSKTKFILRCLSVVHKKQFLGKEDMVITDEIKILISASMVQLTFGLKEYHLPNFRTFIIYPGVYTSPATGGLHRGETNMKGYVILSWQHFIEGYENSEDKINLGLHELAHALDLSRIVKSADPNFYEYFLKFQTVSSDVFYDVSELDHHFLRKYAGANEREFFSVCVEHFFEDPVGFKSNLPKIFEHLVFLLKQDPSMLGKAEHTKLNWKLNNPDLHHHLLNEKVKFKSDFPWWYSARGIIVPLAFFGFFMGLIPDLEFSDVISPFLFIIIVGLIIFIYRFKRVLITENYIFIYSPFITTWRKSYLIENIISIQYFKKKTLGVLKFTIMNSGQVESKLFRLGMDRSEYNRLKESMNNKDVLMTR